MIGFYILTFCRLSVIRDIRIERPAFVTHDLPHRDHYDRVIDATAELFIDRVVNKDKLLDTETSKKLCN